MPYSIVFLINLTKTCLNDYNNKQKYKLYTYGEYFFLHINFEFQFLNNYKKII